MAISHRYFACVDPASKAGDYTTMVIGRFVGRQVVIDEVVQVKSKSGATIKMRLIPNTDPPAYEPI